MQKSPTTHTSPSVDDLVDTAFDAFWQVVADAYPDAVTGDLSPETSVRLTLAAEAAVEEWIKNNAAD